MLKIGRQYVSNTTMKDDLKILKQFLEIPVGYHNQIYQLLIIDITVGAEGDDAISAHINRAGKPLSNSRLLSRTDLRFASVCGEEHKVLKNYRELAVV